MDQFMQALSQQLEQYQILALECQTMINQAPEGGLRITARKSSPSYYHTGLKEEKKEQYIRRKDIGLARQLAQKDYCVKLLRTLTVRIHQMNKLLESYKEDELIIPYTSAISARQKLINPFVLPYEKFLEDWEAKEYPKRIFKEDDPEIYTDCGERVLSKSEKIIADKLHQLRIPYRYEEPMQSPRGTLHPDFTLLHPITREEWKWEHFGMMDDPNYAHNALRKIQTYSQMGYVPGVNLIITFESKACPLDMRMVLQILVAYGFISSE